MSPIEFVEGAAVGLALAYLLFAARELILCWYCALLSSLLYIWIFLDVRLYMEAGLSVFYAVMAVVGWYEWRKGGKEGQGVKIVSLRGWHHAALFALMLALAALNGLVMSRFTAAAWPFVDSFITWSSVITTVLVVRKVLENWLYWIVIDGLAIFVYLERGLQMTALLFALYVVIVVFGYVKWRREYLGSLGYSVLPPVAAGVSER